MTIPLHPLDRPVWSALNSGWAPLAVRAGRALRLDPGYGPFASAPDVTPDSLKDLAGFEPGEDGLWLVEPDAIEIPKGLRITKAARCVQMTAHAIAPGEPDFDVVALSDADAPEMLALARLTRPGPFAGRTHALGGFVGVKRSGRLIAMAGERMRTEDFCEVSGVCTHPDHRGRGYAGGLLRLVSRRILARGQTPFLHAYESNTGAVALYRALGFEVRRVVVLTVLDRA